MQRLLIAALAVFVLFTGGKAEAGMRFCNNSGQTIYTAIGYFENGQWVAEGWWQIFPGNCEYVISGPLDNTYYYARAEGEDGVTYWGESDYFFCTMQTRFLLVDREDCVSGTVQRKQFDQVYVGDSTEHTHNFNP